MNFTTLFNVTETYAEDVSVTQTNMASMFLFRLQYVKIRSLKNNLCTRCYNVFTRAKDICYSVLGLRDGSLQNQFLPGRFAPKPFFERDVSPRDGSLHL